MIETKRVVRILTDLEGVNEDLLNLFDDLRLNIDRDIRSRTQGARMLTEYSEKLDTFQEATEELQRTIQRITGVDLESETQAQVEAATTAAASSVANERIIRMLDREEPHNLSEDFTSKRPYGFTLSGRAFRDIRTWRRFYQILCQQLALQDPERYQALPHATPFAGNRPMQFSLSGADFRFPLKLAYGLYAEGNLSANTLRNNMRSLLKYFGIQEHELTIYLREDRDAGTSEN